jgi:nucleoid DNA-binding protein
MAKTAAKKTPANKSDLVDRLVKNVGLSKKDAKNAVESVLSGIKEFTKKSGIRLVGFGSFTVQKRKARNGFNPATREKIRIKASKTVKFRPGKDFKAKI